MALRLEELNGEWVECRTLLHSWDEIPFDGGGMRDVRPTRSTVVLLFRCTRCSTLRYDAWSRVTGDLIARAYRTPAGYSLPKGRGRKVLVRKEYLRRHHSTNGSRRRRVA
jgi:hypothetical protein